MRIAPVPPALQHIDAVLPAVCPESGEHRRKRKELDEARFTKSNSSSSSGFLDFTQPASATLVRARECSWK